MAIHRRQLAEHGGRDGIRDPGLLSSTLARPRNLLAYAEETPDLAALAAAYAFGIARQHPFIDGNKRTAWVVSNRSISAAPTICWASLIPEAQLPRFQ